MKECPATIIMNSRNIMAVNIVDETLIIKTYSQGMDEVITLVKDINTGFSGQPVSLNGGISILKIKNLKLNERISEFEAQLNKNSSNSSKPPFSDGYGKAPKNSRQKSGRTSGDQSEHEGKTLEKVRKPNEDVQKSPLY